MKKTYIEPKNTVVRINMETLIAASPNDIVVEKNSTIQQASDFGSRETVKSPDAWEEW